MNANEKLEFLSAKVSILVIALTVLALLLIAYVLVECTILFYSMCKKRKKARRHAGGPDGVVIKGGKSKGGKKSKGDKKASKELLKSDQSSAEGSAATGGSGNQQKALPPKKQAVGNIYSNAATAKSFYSFASNATKTEDQIRQISPQFDNDDRTIEQIRNIPPQFESDEKTIDQIRQIPPQFEKDSSPDNTRYAVLNDSAIQQIAATVVAQLERSSKLVAAKGSDFNMPDISVSSGMPFQPDAVAPTVPSPAQQLIQQPTPGQGPPFAQTVPQAAPGQGPPFAQTVPQAAPGQFQYGGPQVGSVYYIESSGPNGEIQKADMPVQPNANNSLMLDGNIVPVANDQGVNNPSARGPIQ